MIVIIAGIGLVRTVSYFMFNILNPYDFSEEIKSLCNRVGGEWAVIHIPADTVRIEIVGGVERADVAGVAQQIVVGVRLVHVGHGRAVVQRARVDGVPGGACRESGGEVDSQKSSGHR